MTDFAGHWAAAEEAILNMSTTHVRVASIPTLQLLLRIGQEREPEHAEKFAKEFELLARVTWKRKA